MVTNDTVLYGFDSKWNKNHYFFTHFDKEGIGIVLYYSSDILLNKVNIYLPWVYKEHRVYISGKI